MVGKSRLDQLDPDTRIVTVWINDLFEKTRPNVNVRISCEEPKFRVFKCEFRVVGRINKKSGLSFRTDAAYLTKISPVAQLGRTLPPLNEKALTYLGEVIVEGLKQEYQFDRCSPITGDRIMLD